jgi:DNA-binding CsgD family transcriptional regulator
VKIPVHSALTPRETQVLQRLIEGDTTREIAASYGIGHQTVKNYVTVIYEKLGVNRRAQLLQMTHAPSP